MERDPNPFLWESSPWQLMKPLSADPASKPRALQVKASSTLSVCIAVTFLYGHTDVTLGIILPTRWAGCVCLPLV